MSVVERPNPQPKAALYRTIIWMLNTNKNGTPQRPISAFRRVQSPASANLRGGMNKSVEPCRTAEPVSGVTIM
jgi:hypothetical protein